MLFTNSTWLLLSPPHWNTLLILMLRKLIVRYLISLSFAVQNVTKLDKRQERCPNPVSISLSETSSHVESQFIHKNVVAIRLCRFLHYYQQQHTIAKILSQNTFKVAASLFAKLPQANCYKNAKARKILQFSFRLLKDKPAQQNEVSHSHRLVCFRFGTNPYISRVRQTVLRTKWYCSPTSEKWFQRGCCQYLNSTKLIRKIFWLSCFFCSSPEHGLRFNDINSEMSPKLTA